MTSDLDENDWSPPGRSHHPPWVGAAGAVPRATSSPRPPPLLVPPPVRAPQAATRGLQVPGRLAQIAIGANLAAVAYGLYASYLDRGVAVDLDRGLDITAERADSVNRALGASALAYGGTLVLAAIGFIVWFHRAYTNLRTVCTTEHRPGWAIGAWFVPFLNLWRPFKIMEELVDGSPPEIGRSSKILFRWWWALWIVSTVFDRFVLRSNPDTPSEWVSHYDVSFVGDAVLLVAGVLVIILIAHVTRSQHPSAATVDAPPPPMPPVVR